MDPIATPADVERLLAESAWVRRLARRLVADQELAEDVAQQSLLVALERRPAVLNLRAWLARLVRNTAWQLNRAEKARRRHEQRSGAPADAERPEDLVAEAELQRRIVDAVLALDEPYRGTVLEHTFRGRTAEEIARRQGVAPGTVRSRLKRALDLLRERFAPEQRTERRAWLGLLLPAAGLEPAAAGAAAALTVGGLVMSMKGIVLAVAVVLATAAAVIWATGDSEPPGKEARGAVPVAVADAAPQDVTAAAPPPEAEAVPGEESGEAEEAPDIRREAVPRAGTLLAGRVIDKQSGAPVPRFYVHVRRRAGTWPDQRPRFETAVEQTIEHAEGAFHIPLDQVGLYRLQVETSRHCARSIDDLDLARPEGLTDLVVDLDPGLSVFGRVLDDRTNEPIQGAIVGSSDSRRSWGDTLEVLATQNPERCRYALTDQDGHFTLSGLDSESQKIAAVRDDYAEGWQQVVPGQDASIEIRLKQGPAAFGTVFDDSGKPREGVRITLYGDELPLTRPLMSGAEGRYRTPPLRPGIVELCADGKEGFTEEWQVAELAGEDVQVDFGVRTDFVQWRGTLYGRDGEPQAGGYVVAGLLPQSRGKWRALLSHRRQAFCDEQGGFAFPKLPMGTWVITASLSDGSVENTGRTVHFDEPGVVELDLRLDRAQSNEGRGAIRGVVIDGATGVPFGAEAYNFVMAQRFTPSHKALSADVDDHGRFQLENLEPGEYMVSANVEDRYPAKLRVLLGEGQVVDDVRMVVPPSGKLRLGLTGFLEADPREFRVHLAAETGDRIWSFPGQLADNGSYETSRSLAEGKWMVTVSLASLGLAQRSFDILAGRITDVRIERGDLSISAGTVTVAGSVRRPDGSPVADAKLHFLAEDAGGMESESRARSATTDDQGSFSATGFWPGLWSVSASFGGNAEHCFENFTIPPEPISPHALDLILPDGSITALLVNGLTGEPLSDAGTRWSACAALKDSFRLAAEINGSTGSRMQVTAVPAGSFMLSVVAQGFDRYTSAVFDHTGRGNVDLGVIRLTPCGQLDFTVVDDSGQPVLVRDLQVSLDGQVLRVDQVAWCGSNHWRCSGLRPGPATFTVQAEGFHAASERVTLEAGKPASLPFVLRRR